MSAKTVYLALLIGAPQCLIPASAGTMTLQTAEYQLKAAYLYNFAKFVEWPADAPGNSDLPLTICVLGRSPIGEALERVAGKTVHNRSVAVCYPEKVEALKESTECDILFVAATESARIPRILAQVSTRSILTVSDIKGFTAAGGMIGFVFVDDKLRFEINPRASHHSGLRISAKLLKLATKVVE